MASDDHVTRSEMEGVVDTFASVLKAQGASTVSAMKAQEVLIINLGVEVGALKLTLGAALRELASRGDLDLKQIKAQAQALLPVTSTPTAFDERVRHMIGHTLGSEAPSLLSMN